MVHMLQSQIYDCKMQIKVKVNYEVSRKREREMGDWHQKSTEIVLGLTDTHLLYGMQWQFHDFIYI